MEAPPPPAGPPQATALGPPSPCGGESTTEGAASPAGLQPASESWTHHYAQKVSNEARAETEDRLRAALEEVALHKAAALEAIAERDREKQRAMVIERQAALRAQSAEDSQAVLVAEYEDRLEELRQLLESERVAHSAEMQDVADRMKDMQNEMQAHAEKERAIRIEAVCEAEARTRDAERMAEEARARAAEEIATVRRSAEARVQEIREQSDKYVRDLEVRRQLEVDRLKAEAATSRRAMEEKTSHYLKERAASLNEAQRRIESNEKAMEMWMATKESELAQKEATWNDLASQQRETKQSSEEHHKTLLEMEKGLHRRTMERTLDRIVQHMSFGEEDTTGRTTPTKELIESARAPQ